MSGNYRPPPRRSWRRPAVRRQTGCRRGRSRALARAAAVHELVAEAALHTEEAARDGVVARRGDLDDAVVLYVQPQLAAYAAVGADGVDLLLLRLVPAPYVQPQLAGY